MAKRSNARAEPAGRVRIIAGEWRGRRLEIAPGTSVRPTPDRVRETLFNWLREIIVGARCLDLYAGTGVLGFEALSRGAAEVWFVETDAALVTALNEHAAMLGVRPRVIRREVSSFLSSPPLQLFDVVFLDPPYAASLAPLLDPLRDWLTERAVVYVERPRAAGLPDVSGAQWLKRAHAGAVEFGLLTWAASST